jgi:hypothetical protein
MWSAATGATFPKALGFTGAADSFFRNLHSFGADVSVVAVAVHMALSWSWATSVWRRVFRRKGTTA